MKTQASQREDREIFACVVPGQTDKVLQRLSLRRDPISNGISGGGGGVSVPAIQWKHLSLVIFQRDSVINLFYRRDPISNGFSGVGGPYQ